MHAMKWLWALALSVVLVGGCLAVLAQEEKGMPDTETRLQRISTELNLTADQKEKLKPILQNQADAWKAVINDQSLSKEQKRAKMKEIHEKYAPDIKAVLTPEQQEKLKAMRDEAWENHRDEMK